MDYANSSFETFFLLNFFVPIGTFYFRLYAILMAENVIFLIASKLLNLCNLRQNFSFARYGDIAESQDALKCHLRSFNARQVLPVFGQFLDSFLWSIYIGDGQSKTKSKKSQKNI